MTSPEQDIAFREWERASAGLAAAKDRYRAACLALAKANETPRPEYPEPGWSLGHFTLGQLRDRLTVAGNTSDWDLSTRREGLEELIVAMDDGR
jgi:hypothetical protein